MKRLVWVSVAVFILAISWGVSEGRMNPSKKDALASFRNQQKNVTFATAFRDSFYNDLHIGALWVPSLSNKGYVGYSDISAYYPGGGNQSSLWQAGMWAGGYVEGRSLAWRYLGSDGDASDPATYDDLDEQAIVATENDLGHPFPYRRLMTHVNTALKPILLSGTDEVDGDMGMDVKYEWHQWGVQGFDNWVFVHVRIAFSKPIRDFYWGWMSDCDVGDVNLPDVYFDDYAGWDDTYKFTYMRDWNYDPLPGQPAKAATADSLWLSPGVIGQYLLAAPPVGGSVTAAPDPSQKWVSKNYWDWNNDVSSVQNFYDRLAGIWENTFPPQDPFDYRILDGVGPYQVAAGDTAHFWMAYVMGEGYDDNDHSTFHLGSLVEHVRAAQEFFNGGMFIPELSLTPRAPDLNPDLAVDVTADELSVHWAPYTNITFGAAADSFIVYTSNISKLGPWSRYAVFDNSVTETTVKLIPGFYTYVWVQAVNNVNGLGSNPFALSSRLYERDESGTLRANENTITSVIGNTAVESSLDKITVAPNPYVGSNEAELEEYATLLGFHHLPAKCTIYIYTLLGNLVDIIHHDAPTGSEFWDMTTRSQESISSGMYIYRVTTEDGQEKVGKFAVIKGQR